MANPFTHNPFKGMPKWGIYASIGGGGLIGAYALYKHHQDTGSWSPFASTSASSTAATDATAASASSGTVTDPTTGDQYSDTAVDPSTSMTYAAEISQYGSVATAEAEVTQYGTSSSSGATYDTGYTDQTATDNLTVANAQNIYTSNSAWSQAVQAGLVDVGYDSTTVGAALGAYLTGTPLTTAQVSIINTAIAEYGSPPVGNLQIIQQPVSTPSTTTTTSTKPTQPYPAPTGLTVTKTTGYGRQLTFNLVSGSAATGPTPTSYTYSVERMGDGKEIVTNTVSTPDQADGKGKVTFNILPLPKGWKSAKYQVRVWANGTTGIGPKSASLEFTQT